MPENIIAGIGLSDEQDMIKAAKEALYQARATIYAEKIDLAIAFCTINFCHPNIIKFLALSLGTVPLIGCSGAAIISDKGIFKNGIVIMLLSIPKHLSFNIGLVKEIDENNSPLSGRDLGEKLMQGFQGINRDLAVIFADGLIKDNSNFILGLQERLGSSFPLIGACASDNLQFSKTFVFLNQELASCAACGIILGGKLNFGWGAKHGWKPLGKERKVTKQAGNIVYEIDNLPAARVYEEYIGVGLSELKKELKRISIFYPIGIKIPGEEEYLLRNVVSIQEDGSLTFQGNIPASSRIRLMIGTKESCLKAAETALEETKKSLYSKRIGFAFIFDSVSRYRLLGRDANKELEIIKKQLGDIPIIGIYTYGELSPLLAIDYQGRAYFHNQTITIVGFEG